MTDPAHLAHLERAKGAGFPVLEGADCFDKGFSRRFLEALEWDAPIHTDPSFARSVGYPDIVAPMSVHTALAMPPYWAPGRPPLELSEPPLMPDMPFFRAFPEGTRTFNLGFKRDALRLVTPGDRLSCEYRICDVRPMTTRVGAGARVGVLATYRNRSGEEVSNATFDLFNYRVAAEVEGEASRGGRGKGEDAGLKGPASAGFSLALSQQRMVMWAGANRDFAPWHFDHEYARGGGAPAAFANTFMIEALYERLLRGLAGSSGTIRSIDFRIWRFLEAGTTVSVLAGTPMEIGAGLWKVPILQKSEGCLTSSGVGIYTRATEEGR